jgi:hypothetical protein
VSGRHVGSDTLLQVAAANAGALREVHAYGACACSPCRTLRLTATQTVALLAAAPLLHTLAAGLRFDDVATARAALRNEAPSFGPLRMRRLEVNFQRADDAGVTALAAAMAAHASLCVLEHVHIYNPARQCPALDAVNGRDADAAPAAC